MSEEKALSVTKIYFKKYSFFVGKKYSFFVGKKKIDSTKLLLSIYIHK